MFDFAPPDGSDKAAEEKLMVVLREYDEKKSWQAVRLQTSPSLPFPPFSDPHTMSSICSVVWASDSTFNDILRKHDEKKPRATYTDPFCQRCKDLRKFVEASDWAIPKAPGMFDSSPPDASDKAAEEKLMREYLGGDAGRPGWIA